MPYSKYNLEDIPDVKSKLNTKRHAFYLMKTVRLLISKVGHPDKSDAYKAQNRNACLGYVQQLLSIAYSLDLPQLTRLIQYCDTAKNSYKQRSGNWQVWNSSRMSFISVRAGRTTKQRERGKPSKYDGFFSKKLKSKYGTFRSPTRPQRKIKGCKSIW